MTAINIQEVAGEMANAAKAVLGEKWPDAKDYAGEEFKKMAETMAFIARQVAAGQMSEKKAKLHLRMQENASQTILLTLEGLSLLAVEEAINAAIDVVRDTVNTAVGFVLL